MPIFHLPHLFIWSILCHYFQLFPNSAHFINHPLSITRYLHSHYQYHPMLNQSLSLLLIFFGNLKYFSNPLRYFIGVEDLFQVIGSVAIAHDFLL